MSSETDTQNRIRKAMSMRGGFLWRNNSGAYKPASGGFVRYGLGNDNPEVNKKFKSSDLIGITPRIIQPGDVGRLFGIFTALEVKRPDWHLIPSDAHGHAQQKFINEVLKCGGFAGFVTHPDQLERMLV